MRRFFRAHRDEDYSQIQYLTAKCTRLAHDKAVLDREFLLSRDRERKLQNDVEAVTTRLLQQEQLNMELRSREEQLNMELRSREEQLIMELRSREEQLIRRIHQQQDLVDLLQQRVGLLAAASSRDGELLQEVGSELLLLQSSEVKLEGLVDELHAEAHHRAEEAERLQDELHRKMEELQQVEEANRSLTEELKDLRSAHQDEVKELQQENRTSLRKLQNTAHQCEWFCEQQRYWMVCVKRFKDTLMEERDALLRQVVLLTKKTDKVKTSLHDDGPSVLCPLQDGPSVLCPLQDGPRVLCPLQDGPSVLCPLQDTSCCDGSSVTSWDAKSVADLEVQVQKSNMLYKELFSQTERQQKQAKTQSRSPLT